MKILTIILISVMLTSCASNKYYVCEIVPVTGYIEQGYEPMRGNDRIVEKAKSMICTINSVKRFKAEKEADDYYGILLEQNKIGKGD